MRILLACALVALPMVADTTATGTAKATVVPAPASVYHPTAKVLDFGTITSGAGGQNKVVAPGDPGADTFSVSKDTNETLNIVLTGGPVTNIKDNTQICTLTTMTHDTPTFSDIRMTDGIFHVGGTLEVPAWIKKGDYSGTYTVTVSYQ